MEYRKLRVIISGGGTGGHIFPAVSIAGKLKEVNPETEILFVGAEGKMEMEKVPAAGYRIVGLPITGLQRKLTVRNILNDILVPFKALISFFKACRIIREFKPDIAVGVGGYASAPLLFAAVWKKVPSLIQEQNGFAGLTNKLLGSRVGCICVAYDGMGRFFPEDKIRFTGNPIRPEIHPYSAEDKAAGIEFYGFHPDRLHLLIVGGSLGSGTLNKAMRNWISAGCPNGEDVEILWQCGRWYKSDIDDFMSGKNLPNIRYTDFIARMDLAYAMADVMISRSGASSISEICAARKAAILVPSPNVAEDHQTHNALALVNRNAGIIVRDSEAPRTLLPIAMELVHDAERKERIEKNVAPLARLDAAMAIVEEIYKLV